MHACAIQQCEVSAVLAVVIVCRPALALEVDSAFTRMGRFTVQKDRISTLIVQYHAHAAVFHRCL